MADDAKTLDIVIRTTAELDGTRAVEAQLERDIGLARTLGNMLPDGLTPGAPENDQPARPRDGTPVDDVFSPKDRADAPVGGPGGGPTEHTVNASGNMGTVPEAAGRGIADPVNQDGETKNPDDPASVPTAPSPPAFLKNEKSAVDADLGGLPAAGGRTLQMDAGLEPHMNAQAQTMLAAGEKLRAALDRNGQASVALLNRTLELIEHQNRQLAETERRISTLAGQIKSLKNK